MKRFVIVAVICICANSAWSDTILSLFPASGSFAVGDKFSISAIVNTRGDNINAVGGSLAFDNELLSCLSIDASQSIFGMWPEYPNFSNASGTIGFAGGLPNPGFTGSGEMFTINFECIGRGTGGTNYEPGEMVLLNNGLGTNVFGSANGGSYNIAVPEPSTLTMLGAGGLAAAWLFLRRKK